MRLDTTSDNTTSTLRDYALALREIVFFGCNVKYPRPLSEIVNDLIMNAIEEWNK